MVGIRVGVVFGCADVVNQMSSCSGARLWDAEVLSVGESVVRVVGDRREWWGFVVAALFVVARVAHQGGGRGVVGVIKVWRGNGAV